MVDLTRDPTPLIELTSEEIRERLYTKKEELGDLAGIPVKLVHINKCPVLAPAATLTAERADELGIDREQCRKSLDLLRAHPEVREKLVEVFNQEFAGSNESDPDTQLYAGFFGHGDKSTMDLVRATPADLLGEREFAFTDSRLPEMLFRYRARNWPHTLSEAEQKRWRLHCSDYFSRRLPDYVPRLEALAEQNQSNERNFAILKSLYHYLEDL